MKPSRPPAVWTRAAPTSLSLINGSRMKALLGFGFDVVEATAFLLPAFPDARGARLLILLIYWVGHAMGLQREYLRLKRRWIP
jgi:hypothetical protein